MDSFNYVRDKTVVNTVDSFVDKIKDSPNERVQTFVDYPINSSDINGHSSTGPENGF
ncbi:MAG TPA: hypothetical protein VKQ08_10770 [Cyclobacteriaceae bacterium]|nr:hypothetical protein [Cyclobacteriaceae bacterium]